MLRDKPRGVRERISDVGLKQCAISEITLAELFYGAAKSGKAKHRAEVYEIAARFPILPITDALDAFGEVKAALESEGKRIDDFDLLIGVTAVQHGLTLVTHNTRHFLRIPNLHIEDWEQGE